MADEIEFYITDLACQKIREIMVEEKMEPTPLRVFWEKDGSWGFTFDDALDEGDQLLEFDGVQVVLGPDVIDRLRLATVSYDDDGFVIQNALDLPETEHRRHLKDLPNLPTIDELALLRRGLRKQKSPDPRWMTTGGHPEIGQFVFEHRGGITQVTWNIVGAPSKQAAFSELCTDPNRELDRLELGWMIANMAELDRIHGIDDAKSIPDPNYCMREMSRISNYFSKIEKRWRHWAIVPAGFMLD